MTVTLGGSTIGSAAGIDPWCSPIRLWCEMTGRTVRHESEQMALGKLIQPVIFAALRERGYDAVETPSVVLTSTDLPWMIGHPDGVIALPEKAPIVEAKAMGYDPRGLPPQHEAQVQTYMHLAGCDRGIVAQLAGLHLTVFEVERNQRVIDTLLALGQEFVGYVERDEQPPPLGHPDDRAALLVANPTAVSGKVVRETRETRDVRRELAALLEAEKTRHERIEHLRARLTSFMGDAETLLSLHDETVATWRNVTSARMDTKRLRQDRPEIAAEYTSETETRRLNLT